MAPFRSLACSDRASASSAVTLWAMSPELYFRCAQCDYFMSGDPSESDQCFCGAMSKDADYGRFGSDLGDAQIEVFRAEPRRARWRHRLKRDEK